jgi:uncharacterized repeat protein (TIGR01451 family)
MILLMIAFTSVMLQFVSRSYASTPTWPSSWIQVDWDKNEDGSQDDWRDVEYAYYNFDSNYLYLRLECYAAPGSNWPGEGARYKWFIDLDNNLYISGGNVIEAEYLLFVEDTDNDGQGELYLLHDNNNNGDFEEYEPWPPSNYAVYKITDVNVGAFRITGNFIDMYISWSALGNPSSYGLYWVTDQENPNLNQAPTTDSRDEEIAIRVHDVAAISQTVNATNVIQGAIIEINVTVINLGMQNETFDVTCYFYPTIIGTQRVINLEAGKNVTLTFYWNTRLVDPGNYYIRALADSSGEILEVNETNNWCTSPTTVTVCSAPKHDVAAVSQVANVTRVQQGGIVQINVTVENLGDFNETFNVACFYNGSGFIGVQQVTLLSGQKMNVTFNWNTAGVAPETYFITAMADSGREIVESDETNNNCTTLLPVAVYTPAGIGVLSVDKILVRAVEGPDPAIVNSTTKYEIMMIVANVGNGNITNVWVNDTIYSGVTYVEIGTPSKGSASYNSTESKIIWQVGDLAPLENATLNFNVTLTPNTPGNFTLNRGIDLFAKGTNSTGGEVTDYGDLDVVVEAYTRDIKAVSQTPNKTVVVQGEIVGIDVEVENSGNYYNETYNVRLFYNSSIIDTLRVFNQKPGNATTLRFAWNTSGVLPGIYIITARADVNGEIPESNEENNNCTFAAYIKVVVHDVAVTSQVPSPTIVVQGELVTINVTVTNKGTETETFTVKVYYYGETECCSNQTVTLGSGETETLTFVWNTAGIPPGTYYIEARALPVDGELNTDDNTCTSTAAVTVNEAAVVTFYQIGVGPDFTGPILNVDGINYTVSNLPKSFTWVVGSSHTFTFYDERYVGSDKRYVWMKTRGLSTGQGGTITVQSGGGTVNATYITQYIATITASPSGALGGTFKVTFTHRGGTFYGKTGVTPYSMWVDSGTWVNVTNPQQSIDSYEFYFYAPSDRVFIDGSKTITLVYREKKPPPVGGTIISHESTSPITPNTAAPAIILAITVCALIITVRKKLKA